MRSKVLIVDDDIINRLLLKTLLRKNASFTEIREAENGAQALHTLHEDPGVDLILLDIMMPVLDGIEFLKVFRSKADNADIPVIVLSTDDERKNEVFEAGANDFLRKPIKEEELFNTIERWT